jgi:hypothetical protein
LTLSQDNSDWIADYIRHDPDASSIAPATKGDRKSAARAIIDRYSLHVVFRQHDVDALNRILGTNYAAFVKRTNPKYPSDSRHLYAIASMEAISWNKAISPEPEILGVKKVMRQTTQELLNEFLNAIDNPVCRCCGSRADLTADHSPPFDLIASEFIAANGVPKIDDAPDGVGAVFVDIDVEAAWIAFHQSRTTLSVLCRPCNSSKGKHGECRLDHEKKK